ncbi:ATP-binding cassette domain-containing protein [Bombilactobacillus bombi]|uniref:ATP-binding cassette domain-containing protein n=1 Tax=Bombilactobacillus bombi TaxID=1303590 RepID=UPI0015E6021B|nr:ATP-binding cassette domain-containing protein [Bombilactobacillus bombi]MBA1434318.1 ATP-binding cassette domain-containing protein [Bombilactobacillus bombi]
MLQASKMLRPMEIDSYYFCNLKEKNIVSLSHLSVLTDETSVNVINEVCKKFIKIKDVLSLDYIDVKKARVHNLKEISLSIPKGKLVVATGVSGSGKSSLLFDLIFEEGRKLYLEEIGAITGITTDSNYESISGISPTVAVKQSVVRQKNPRSTLGSKTNILKLLCSLYETQSEKENLNIESGAFSYNNPKGMCKTCLGLGEKYNVQIDEVTNNGKLSINEVLEKLKISKGIIKYFERQFEQVLAVPFNDLSDQNKNEFIFGHYVENNADKRSYCLDRILAKKIKNENNIENYYKNEICPVCKGKRLESKSLSVKVCGYDISDLCMLSIIELKNFFSKLNIPDFSYEKQIVASLISELNALISLDVGYLSMYRKMSSLSGGEIQKIYLSELSRSSLNSIIYILDEPLSGLYPTEKKIVFKLVDKLISKGNSVLVVDHDKEMIKRADYIIDIGPKAGVNGGSLVYTGDYKGLLLSEKSLTGKFLADPESIFPRSKKMKNGKTINLTDVHDNNLQHLDIKIPIGGYIVGIAGKSGSGKTTLLNALEKKLKMNQTDNIKLISVSQAPIGRSINSNLVTFLKIWDEIRKIYEIQAKVDNFQFTKSDFSFNSKGACEKCNGTGRRIIEFGDGTKLTVKCQKCGGKRYKKEILNVKYKNLTIFDTLQLQVSEAVNIFKESRKIKQALKVVTDIGLEYLKLGQPTSTLSGGEAQRLKLAKELERTDTKKCIYTLDEPTTGLSYYDVSQLLKLLDKLVQKDSTVVVCEHNTEFLKRCDWIIELGPGSGNDGGKIIAQGTPDEIKNNIESDLKNFL